MRSKPVYESCREELGEPTYGKCGETAEFLLWGKLFPPEALGPRCWEHTIKHTHTDHFKDWAVLDLRNLVREIK